MSKEQLYDKDGNPVYVEKKKRGGCLKWLMYGVIVLIVLGACSALLGGGDDNKEVTDEQNTEETTEEKATKDESKNEKADDSKTEYNVGEIFEHDGVEVVVNEVERIEGGQFDSVDEGNNFVRIYLTINNHSDNEVSYNPLNFEIQTSEGNILDSFTFPPSGSDNVMTSGKLAEDGTMSANLFYEVPADDNGLILRYKPSFFKKEIIKFNLN